ncbi:hypothetical protein Cs7R123_57100 [Catellatospora sp. TT07R-123]|uniref:extracellular solute-binding protein n=1 Tax=Catellatospora sp. TT07R-123 TaxID=2733863 RepID=UPI001B11132D|nr:extracellular solute-binding protein [Catellatospora sp. TT07R-123]GHJ48368.1 hypothetical protein Cs7R123_57100 [Catellatospora sp. TT07R-123]
MTDRATWPLANRRQLMWSAASLAVGAAAGALAGRLWAGPAESGPVDDDLEKGELVIATGPDESPGRQREQLFEMWNHRHPEQRVRTVTVRPGAEDAFLDMTALATSGVQVDVFNLDVVFLAGFAAARYIQPVDVGLLPAGFLDGFLEKPKTTCYYRHQSFGEQLFGLPFNTDAGLLFYRGDWALAEPFSWKSIGDAAGREVGAAPGVAAGLALQLADAEIFTISALEALWSQEISVVDDAGRVVVDIPRWTKALSRLSERPTVYAESQNQDESASRDAFIQGKTLFMRNWPVHSRWIRERVSEKDFHFKVTGLPWSSALGGQNLAIATKTRSPRAAQRLIEFLTNDESQFRLFSAGGFAATRESLYSDETIKEKYDYAEVLKSAIANANSRPVTAHYAEFSTAFRAAVRPLVVKGTALPANLAELLNDAMAGKTAP